MSATPAADRVITDADELFSVYGDMIFRLAFIRTLSRSDAEDVTQEVIVRFILNGRKGKGFRDGEHQKAWLIRVTLNCCNDMMTSASRKHDVPEQDDRSEIPAPEKEDFSDVTEAVTRLEPGYREVIHLFYYEDRSVRQIADLLGITAGTVKTRLSRARDRLGEALKGAYGR